MTILLQYSTNANAGKTIVFTSYCFAVKVGITCILQIDIYTNEQLWCMVTITILLLPISTHKNY